ncbi:hypothetical protein BCR34DRAFT_560808 [Clohesyomyces aquaticus]|uniref:Uncharacterized protein n=1 Tax=Clohesyomyces aquaticus TaxID=1231657 RepID=A0A1Y1ZWN2_9PLEO|nr:hypothetical protein BCR34DRAFT_560808 [Clohesyomyces aquaticus]
MLHHCTCRLTTMAILPRDHRRAQIRRLQTCLLTQSLSNLQIASSGDAEFGPE